ncbi:hypothetical protein [Symmachiella dynata]|uniref:hypothetical protein n=1 Tax=Symmachiella dynata TaxID=2527995 RepID=UPI0030EBF249
MRPCQHCGKAILLSDTVCPLCDGEQVASVGGGATGVGSSQADDRTVVQRQEQVQWEAEKWLFRTAIIVPVSINAGLVLFGYLIAGVQGAGWAMSGVALLVGGIILLLGGDDPSGIAYLITSSPLILMRKLTSEDDLTYSFLRAVILLAIVNGIGAYFCL